MKNIKVLGSGCKNCETTAKLIAGVAKAKDVSVEIEKIEDIAQIMGYGVMSTPGVVIGDTVVHAGGIPGKAAIEDWLTDNESAKGCCGGDGQSGSSGCCG